MTRQRVVGAVARFGNPFHLACMIMTLFKKCLTVALLGLLALPSSAQFLGPGDFEYPQIEEDQRIAYGADSLQWGVLRIPEGEGPHPVVVMMHGGCWVGLHRPRHVEPLMDAVTDRGWATWSLSHRQANDNGGGWTGTFDDVGAGIDYVRELAGHFDLDTSRVVAMGHSAGGHLALWAAGRDGYRPGDALYATDPLQLAGAVSLGGIADLRAHVAQEVNPCGEAVLQLMDYTPDDLPERYAEASPAERLPLGTPQLFLHGRQDYVIPWQQISAYAEVATSAGDEVRVHFFEEASHFEVIAPASEAWSQEIGPALMDWLMALPAVESRD